MERKVSTKRHQLWTIGHSTRSLDEFVDLLKEASIQCLADVRSLPGSRKFPQFNKERLAQSLPERKIQYVHLKKLGGRRPVQSDSENTVWQNKSFRAYADYMETDGFEDGIRELMKLAEQKNTAVMCAEAVWWRCHRSMIADALKVRGWKVMHIMGHRQIKEHPYTKPAKEINGKLIYGTKKESTS